MTSSASRHSQIQEFIDELSGFAATAENTLSTIESDLEAHKGLFSVFAERMFAIRGTAQQLSLPHIAEIAGFGEEIAIKGSVAQTRPQLRKCVGSLWDALTTVKYLLVHYTEETSEEQKILINRMQVTLQALGGKRPTMSEDEIADILKARSSS